MAKIAYNKIRMGQDRLDMVETCNGIIAEYQAQGFTLTLRQLYYQCVARGLIANKQSEYKRLGDIINDARLAGMIDWETIEDRTRGVSTISSWSDPKDILDSCAKQFKLDLWSTQPYRVECWVEKEALAGVIEDVSVRNRVPFLSCRGYTSQSEMWRAAMRLCRWVEGGQKVLILHLGDHDPSGIDMSRDIQDRLRLFMGGNYDQLEFRRLALNFDQVKQYNPPPNPAKADDSRYEGYSDQFGKESWELDALEPKILHKLVEDAILEVRDDAEYGDEQEREDRCRELLGKVSDQWDGITKNLT